MDELLSIGEAAQRLKVSKHTINFWLREGRLRRTKVATRTRIRVSELEALIVDGAGPSALGFARPKASESGE